MAQAKQAPSNQDIIPVFRGAARENEDLAHFTLPGSSDGVVGFNYLSFAKPVDVMVSRWYPGYRVTDLTGPDAEEAIALLLGAEMNSTDDLEDFRRLMSSPGRAAAVISRLFSRPGVPIKERKYVLTEPIIANAVKAEFLGAAGGDLSFAAQAGFAYAITRVLSAKGWVAPAEQQRIVRTAKSLMVSASDLRRIIMVEAMRGIFSESRIVAATRALDSECTPEVLGEKIGDMFRQFAFSIPEIKLRLEQFDIVTEMIRLYCVRPELISNSLAAHPSLVTLSSMANFIVYAAEMGVTSLSMPAFATDEIKTACNEILTVIQSAPSVEMMPLSRYADYFGEVPASSPDGFRRGLVVYGNFGQTSKMEIVDVYPKAMGVNVAMVDPAYVGSSALAGPLSGSLLSVSAVTGLANVVADELASSPLVLNDDGRLDPMLMTIQVNESDLILLAMARAREVAFTSSAPSSPGTLAVPKLMFGCAVAEQWRTVVTAATPSIAFFFNPEEVIVYTSKMVQREPKPLPSRSQSVSAEIGHDRNYVGEFDDHLIPEISIPFRFTVPVSRGGATAPVLLPIEVSVMGILANADGTPVDRGDAFYAAVREPGVDREVLTLLRLALAYAKLSQQDIQGDKARSWLIINLAPIMLHPAVRQLAERAVNIAVIRLGLDARRLAPQMREVHVKTMFGTALAVLNRFGKIDGDMVASLVSAVPTNGLSLQASLVLAQLPAAINGSL